MLFAASRFKKKRAATAAPSATGIGFALPHRYATNPISAGHWHIDEMAPAVPNCYTNTHTFEIGGGHEKSPAPLTC